MQYSFWPLIFSIFNLPRHVRNKPTALILYGLVPSHLDRKGKGIEPNLSIYQEVLVDELIQLSSIQLFSSYKQAPVRVKVSLLLYMMDFQAYRKYFNMTGAGSYLPCHLCLMKAKYSPSCSKMLLVGHDKLKDVQRRTYSKEVCKCVNFV